MTTVIAGVAFCIDLLYDDKTMTKVIVTALVTVSVTKIMTVEVGIVLGIHSCTSGHRKVA